MIAIREEIARVEAGEWTPGGLAAAPRPAHGTRARRRVGPLVLARARRLPAAASTPTSTGRRWPASTRPTATATWSARARRRRRSRRTDRARCSRVAVVSDERQRLLRRRAGRGAADVGRRCGVRPLRRGVGGRGRAGARPRRPVPDRVDHQDDDGRPRHAGARRGSARSRRRTRGAPGRRRLRRRDGARRSRPLLRDAERAPRTVVGAHAGRRLPSARRRQRRQRPGGARRRLVPLLQPRLRPPRRGRRTPVRCALAGAGVRAPPPAPRHADDVVPAPSRRPARLERRPLHRRPGPRAAHRHRGDGSGRAALVHPRRPRRRGDRCSAVPAPTCSRRRRWRRCSDR